MNVITNANSIPQLNAVFYCHTVTYDDIVFNKTVRADIAVLAYRGMGQYDDILPDVGVGSDLCGLDISGRMNGHYFSPKLAHSIRSNDAKTPQSRTPTGHVDG